MEFLCGCRGRGAAESRTEPHGPRSRPSECGHRRAACPGGNSGVSPPHHEPGPPGTVRCGCVGCSPIRHATIDTGYFASDNGGRSCFLCEPPRSFPRRQRGHVPGSMPSRRDCGEHGNNPIEVTPGRKYPSDRFPDAGYHPLPAPCTRPDPDRPVREALHRREVPTASARARHECGGRDFRHVRTSIWETTSRGSSRLTDKTPARRLRHRDIEVRNRLHAAQRAEASAVANVFGSAGDLQRARQRREEVVLAAEARVSAADAALVSAQAALIEVSGLARAALLLGVPVEELRARAKRAAANDAKS